MDQNYIIDTLKNNINRQSALDTLIDFERVLDNQNIYTYANWLDGEVVEGPHIEKYWVTVTLMYHQALMPDPEGAMRLTRNGCKVYFAEEEYITAAKLRSPDDSEGQDGADGKRPGQTRAKRIIKPVWLVTIVMPRKYMNDVEAAKLRVDDQGIDSNAVEQAYTDEISAADEGLDL